MFWRQAKENTPPSYRKPRAHIALKTARTGETTKFEGLPLVQHLLGMGLKKEAVAAYQVWRIKQGFKA